MAMPPIPPGPVAMDLAPPERRRKLRKNVVDSQLVTVDLGFQKGALLLDLSEEGMGVQALAKARLGTTTALFFDLPDSLVRIEAMGRVAWTDNSGRAGIRFSELSSVGRTHLIRWLSRWNGDVSAPAPAGSIPLTPPLEPQDELEELRREIRQAGLQRHVALDLVAQRGRALTRATGAAIALDLDGRMVCVATSGNAPDLGVALNPHAGLSGECVRSGEMVRCADTETDPRADRLVCRRLNLRSAVVLPLRRQQQVLGVLEVFSDVPHAFENREVLLLRRLAEMVVSLTVTATIITPEPMPPAEEAPSPLPQEKPPLLGLAEVPVGDFLKPSPPRPPQAVQLALPQKPAEPAWDGATVAPTRVQPSALTGQAEKRPDPQTAPPMAAKSAPATVPAALRPPSLGTASPGAAEATTISPRILRAHRVAVLKKVFKWVLAATITVGLGWGFWQLQQGMSAAPESHPSAVPPAGPGRTAAAINPPSLTGGNLVRRVEPTYPEAARKQGLQGQVVLKARVDKSGRVREVQVVSGNPLLARAAAEAVRHWRYEPFRRKGEPVETETLVSLQFAPPQR